MNAFNFEEFCTCLKGDSLQKPRYYGSNYKRRKMYLKNKRARQCNRLQKAAKHQGNRNVCRGHTGQKHCKATTQAEKLHRIKVTIKCLSRRNDNQTLYYWGSRTMDY